jgi:hypothetical protein
MTRLTLMRAAFEDDSGEALAILTSSDEGLVPVRDQDLQGAHDDSEKIDELISTAGALEDVEKAVQSSCEQDGLSYPAAKALDVAFEHFKSRAGIPSEKTMSMEGFAGGRSSRLYATNVALESDIGETIRRMVKKVIAWIKHVALMCYDMIERLFRGANAVIERAQSIHRAAAEISHHKFNRDKIEQISKSSLTSFFNKAGHPLSAQEVTQAFVTYCNEVNTLFSAGRLYAPCVQGLTELDHYLNMHGEKAIDMGAVEGFAAHACEELAKNSLKHFEQRKQEDADVLVSSLPFGNSALLCSFVHGSINPDHRIGFHLSIETNPVESAAALTPMKPQEVMNLMSVLTAQMSRGIYRDSKKIKAAIHDVATRVEKESYRLSDRQRQMGASVVPTLNTIKAISDSSMKLTRLLYTYTGITTRRLLSLSQASLQAYEKAIVR